MDKINVVFQFSTFGYIKWFRNTENPKFAHSVETEEHSSTL